MLAVVVAISGYAAVNGAPPGPAVAFAASTTAVAWLVTAAAARLTRRAPRRE
jgi:hypothetical protein